MQESIARLRLAKQELAQQMARIDNALAQLGDPLVAKQYEGSTVRAVLEAMSSNPAAIWTADDFPDHRRGNVHSAFAHLASEGAIHRVRRGEYRLGPDPHTHTGLHLLEMA